MKYNKLGSSEFMVSEVCLGTMTWGNQNTEEDAHEQIEYALSKGVNFIDTAELYPVPVTDPTYVPGVTETILGNWLANNSDRRSDLIIATKVVGYMASSVVAAHRTDPPAPKPYPPSRLDAPNIRAACAASLKRLKTDYIDLYQLHWPDRYVPMFGSREYRPGEEIANPIPIRDTLLAVKELLDGGKVRAYGLSNETSFGVCEFVRVADELGMPRPVSIQNDFGLMLRSFEGELAEACAPSNFDIALLPWSVLAGGMLTGKYHTKGAESREVPRLRAADEKLKKSRFVLFPDYMTRFHSKAMFEATTQYMKVAEEADMSSTTLAHAFCKSRWFIPSTIIGATSMDHLKENIAAFDVDLDAKTLKNIDDIHNSNKDPAQRTIALDQIGISTTEAL